MDKLLFPSSSLFLFIFFLCTITKLVTSQSPLVSKFCHNGVQDPNFCLKVVSSDPRSTTAKNAHDLEGLTIDLGSNFAKTVTDKCTSLLQSEKDVKMKAALGSCTGAYSLVNLDFDSIRVAFQSGGNIDKQGAGARVSVLKCNKDFDDMKLISPLANDNSNLLNFIQIILANYADH